MSTSANVKLLIHPQDRSRKIVPTLRILLILYSLFPVALMLVGIIIFGVESASPLDWGFAVTVVGAAFTLGAGVTSAVQMRQSDVPCCGKG